MASRILLHIGLHKTATTSIQDFLQAQRARLAERSVFYVPRPSWRSRDDRRLSSPKRMKKWLTTCESEVLMLSEENLIGVPRQFARGKVYPKARKNLAALMSATGTLPVDLFIVFRDPGRFLASMYCEYLRHHAYLSFNEFIEGHDIENFSWLDTFAWLDRLPDRVTVHRLPFEPGFGGGVERIVSELLDCACGPDAGIDLASFPRGKSRSSYSAEEIALAGTIARSADAETASAFLKMLDRQNRRFGAEAFSPFPVELGQRLTARYREELPYLTGQG